MRESKQAVPQSDRFHSLKMFRVRSLPLSGTACFLFVRAVSV